MVIFLLLFHFSVRFLIPKNEVLDDVNGLIE